MKVLTFLLLLSFASTLLSLSYFPFVATVVRAQTEIQTTSGDTGLIAAVPPGRTMIPPSSTITQFVDDTGLTINYLPPDWTVIEEDNTSDPEMVAIIQGDSATAAVLCPPYSKANLTYSLGCDEPSHGEIIISYYPAMDKNDNIVRDATKVNPETGLLELNLTPQNILDYEMDSYSSSDIIVQNKTVPVNVTNLQNGTTYQAQGMQVLFTNPASFDLTKVGLYVVDNTTGYSMTVNGPSGDPRKELSEAEIADTEELSGFSKGLLAADPRGEPIKIHGIGLDNLPEVLAEPMKIIDSVSITRK